MYFGDVLVVDSGCCLPCCLLVLWEAWVVGGEDADMFDHYFIGLCSEPVDFESAQCQHFVVHFSIVDGDEIGEQLLFGGEGAVGGDPVFCISHLNDIIN